MLRGMKLIVSLALALCCSPAICTQSGFVRSSDITALPYQQLTFDVPDSGETRIPLGNAVAYIGYRPHSESIAQLKVFLGKHEIYSTMITDLWNPNGWIVLSPDHQWFAFTWSDGGAIGGFHTRLFEITQATVEEKTGQIKTIEREFSRLHFCRTRGNNYSAVRWLSNRELLVEASVYPTGDCDQLGYTDRFVLEVTTGKTVQRQHVPDQP